MASGDAAHWSRSGAVPRSATGATAERCAGCKGLDSPRRGAALDLREVSLPWEGRFNLQQSEASRDFLVQAEVCLSVSTYSRMSVVEVSSMFRHDGFILRQDGFRTLGKERKPMDPKFVGATPRIDARIIRMRNFADTNRRADRVHIFDLSKISDPGVMTAISKGLPSTLDLRAQTDLNHPEKNSD